MGEFRMDHVMYDNWLFLTFYSSLLKKVQEEKENKVAKPVSKDPIDIQRNMHVFNLTLSLLITHILSIYLEFDFWITRLRGGLL